MSAQQDESARDDQGIRSRLRRRPPNPEARMSLVEHIRELRRRIFRALLAALVGSIIAWIFLYHPVWHFVEAPYCKLPSNVTALPDAHAQGCTLYVTGIFDALMLKLKLSMAIGVIISAPIWLYQLWAFIAPGLHSRERRWAYFFAGSAFPLFAAGGAIAYFAMTKGLRFLTELLPQGVLPLFTIDKYLGFAMAMLLIFGLSFELPLIMVLLNLVGMLTHERFAKWRRLIIFAVFAFAAVATPSPDPISMLLLAVPCVILVELAEVFTYVHDRRRARRGPVYPGLSAEDVAEYGLDTGLSGPGMAGEVYVTGEESAGAVGVNPGDGESG